MHKKKILIVGYGLIGVSIAKSIPNALISVFDIVPIQDPSIIYYDNLKIALKQHYNVIVLSYTLDTNAIDEIFNQISTSINHNTFTVDVWSVKECVQKYVNILPNFYPCHPIAGSEKSGHTNASQNIIYGKNVIVTKSDSQVQEFWNSCGMNPIFMNSTVHDQIYAEVSHFPQLLSFALAKLEEDLSQPYLRLASSNYQMWKEIFTLNRDNLKSIIDKSILHIRKIPITQCENNLSSAIGWMCDSITTHQIYAGSGFKTITMHKSEFNNSMNQETVRKIEYILNIAYDLLRP